MSNLNNFKKVMIDRAIDAVEKQAEHMREAMIAQYNEIFGSLPYSRSYVTFVKSLRDI